MIISYYVNSKCINNFKIICFDLAQVACASGFSSDLHTRGTSDFLRYGLKLSTLIKFYCKTMKLITSDKIYLLKGNCKYYNINLRFFFSRIYLRGF